MTLLRMVSLSCAVAVVLGAGGAARADVRLPGLISDNMVLQRGKPVRIWGWADPGEKVTVRFQGKSASDTAQDGRWSVTLRGLATGGQFPMTIEGKNKIEFGNVAVGEVWVASGQSNMEWTLRNAFEAERHIAASANPNIRLFTVPKKKSATPVEDVAASWQVAAPETTPNFSAVGYFFARDLQKALGVPVGVIHTSWGGSPAEAWTKRSVLESRPEFKSIMDAYWPAVSRWYQARLDFPNVLAKAKAEGKTEMPREPNRPWMPSELYNGMIAPLLPYRIAGAIWYQGESNAGRAAQYRTLFPAMIQNWRDDWGQGDFPFLAVQLAPYMAISPEPQESGWAELREAQWMATKMMPNVGMAVITDVGEEKDIHPRKKEPVGARLALLARDIAYGENIVANGPALRSWRVDGNRAILTFDNAASGLEARGDKLTGFAIKGADGKWVWGDATIDGGNVIVSASSVERPVAVRYGWANYPVVNLWNKEGIPAQPFRTDVPEIPRWN